MTIKLKIDINGMWKYKIGDIIANSLLKSCDKITEVAKLTSQKDYLQKKKSEPKYPSMIFDSFIVEKSKFLSSIEVQGIVFAGGVKPNPGYWAIYLDEGFMMRNKQPWPGGGYHFMYAGAKAAEDLGPKIISIELGNAYAKVSADRTYVPIK